MNGKKNKNTFPQVVKRYSNWKIQEGMDGRLSRKEIMNLRERYFGKNGQENKQSVREEKKQDFETFLNNFKQYRESLGDKSRISWKELKGLKETWAEAQKKGIYLREADAGLNPAAPMPGDPNAMADPAMGADPNAMGAPPDPMAMQGAIDQAISALQPFTQAGADPLAGDPNAGIPPVDGQAMGAADPNAGAPMMEAYLAWKQAKGYGDKLTEADIAALEEQAGKQQIKEEVKEKPKGKYSELQERIAARKARVQALQEQSSFAVETIDTLAGPHVKKPSGFINQDGNSQNGGKGSTAPAGPSHIENVPSPAALSNGYSSGKAAGETKPAKTWPTKATGKEAGGALQGASATQTRVKEEQIQEEKEDNLQEATRTVTDAYVDRHLNDPKLSFDAIRESMHKGLLG